MSFITGYFTLKSYKQGLTHSWELKHDMKPTESVNPLVKIYEDKKKKEEEEVVNEWLNDPRDEG